jgi:hypothetical protein
MDKLANRLRNDAENIEAKVSDELDSRIRASLRGVTPMTDEEPTKERQRRGGFWWASSLTGIAAAAAIIAIINSQQEVIAPPATPTNILAAVPTINLKTETAVMTGPLQEELDNLQSDLKKAEKRVRDEIGF